MILKTIRRIFGKKEPQAGNDTSQTTTILGSNNSVTQNINVYLNKSEGDFVVEEVIARETSLQVAANRFQLDNRSGASSDAERESEPETIHKTIDTYRDLINTGKSLTAIDLLKGLLEDSLPPFAQYRVNSNLGYAFHTIGRDAEAAEWWTRAATLRPSDIDAKATGALAQLLKGDPGTASRLAQEILHDHPTQELASAVLVYSRVEQSSISDPLAGISEACRSSANVLRAVVSFWRWRDDDRWRELAVEAESAHPEDQQLRILAAESRLSRIEQHPGFLIGEKVADDVMSDLYKSADALQTAAEESLREEVPDTRIVGPLVNNAAVALRLTGRTEQAERLISNGLAKLGNLPYLLLQQVLLFAQRDQHVEGLRLIGDNPPDPELALMGAELAGVVQGPEAGFSRAKKAFELGTASTRRAAAICWAEFSLAAHNEMEFHAAIDELKAIANSDPNVVRLQTEGERAFSPAIELTDGPEGDDEDENTVEELPAPVADSLSGADSWTFPDRFLMAVSLNRQGSHEKASDLLVGLVDLNRDSVSLRLLLEATINAGLNARATSILESLGSDARQSAAGLRFAASLHYNTGDVRKALPQIRRLAEISPRNLRNHLWLFDALIRTNERRRARQVLLSYLERGDIEGGIKDKCNLIRALVHVGEIASARQIAYRLWVQEQPQPDIWNTLSGSVLALEQPEDNSLDVAAVGENTAFTVERPSSERRTYVIEPDPQLQAVTRFNVIPPTHPIAQAANGLKVGEEFDWPIGSGGRAKVQDIRHKVVAAFHNVLQDYEERFFGRNDFRSVSIDTDRVDGLSELTEVLRERDEYVKNRVNDYKESKCPLAVLATLTGLDIISAFKGLSSVDAEVRTTLGSVGEREVAYALIRRNKGRGIIADPTALHAIRELKIEGVVRAVCGPIGITQETRDIYKERCANAEMNCKRGHRVMSFVDGRINFREATEEDLNAALKMTLDDYAWVERECEVIPSIPARDPPQNIRRFRSMRQGAFLADIYAASGTDRILVSEDYYLRQIGKEALDVKSTWLQPILQIAKEKTLLSLRDYALCVAALRRIPEAGLTVNADTIVEAALLGVEQNPANFSTFETLTSLLGGKEAEPISHLNVVLWSMNAISEKKIFDSYAGLLYSKLLTSLTRDRYQDYASMLGELGSALRKIGKHELYDYIVRWRKGHFL